MLHLNSPRVSGELGVALGTGKQTIELLQTLKSLMRSKVRKAGKKTMEHIEVYPCEPSASLRQVAYDEDDPPCTLTAPVVGKLQCLRKTSKAAKDDSPPGTELVPARPAQKVAEPSAMGFSCDPMQMFQLFQMFHSMQGGGSSTASSSSTSPNLLQNLQVFSNKSGTAVTPPPQNRVSTEPPTSATKAADALFDSPPDEGKAQELQLILPEAKVASPEEQSALVKAALARRQSAKAEVKEAESKEAKEESKPHAKAKKKAKAKGKAGAKAKTQNEKKKGEAETAPAPTKRKTEKTAEVSQPSAKAKAMADKKVWSKEAPPPVPQPKSGTTYYRHGKIHRNSGAFRVFLNCKDRCDKKVKIVDEENCSAEWQRALKLIDEAPADVE